MLGGGNGVKPGTNEKGVWLEENHPKGRQELMRVLVRNPAVAVASLRKLRTPRFRDRESCRPCAIIVRGIRGHSRIGYPRGRSILKTSVLRFR